MNNNNNDSGSFNDVTKVGLNNIKLSTANLGNQLSKINIPSFKINLPELNSYLPSLDILTKCLESTKFRIDDSILQSLTNFSSDLKMMNLNIEELLKPFKIFSENISQLISAELDSFKYDNCDNIKDDAYISDEISEQIINLVTETIAKTNLSEDFSPITTKKKLTVSNACEILAILIALLQLVISSSTPNINIENQININQYSLDNESTKKINDLTKSINELNIKIDELSTIDKR